MEMDDNFYDDVQDWEPKTFEEWERFDPIGPRADWPRINTNIERSTYSARTLFYGWRKLPLILRAQVWREREIAAYLYRNSREWGERLPIVVAVGVTKRNLSQVGTTFPFFPGFPDWDHPLFYEYWRALRHQDIEKIKYLYGEIRERWGISVIDNQSLTGTLFINRSIPITQELYNFLRIAPLRDIESRISNYSQYGLSPLVPISIEYSDDFVLLAGNIAVQTIQGGTLIRGEHPSGFRKPGTLTVIAKQKGNDECIFLGAQHVLGEKGNKIIYNGQPIGEVIDSDDVLDAAIAKLYDSVIPEKSIKGLSITPAAPVFVTTGLSIQYEGGVSGAQFGIVDTVNRVAPGQYRVGTSPSFTIIADGKPGDSGSLIISGNGIQSFIPQSFVNQNPQLANLYSAAMLGILLAGPGPNYPKQEPPKIIARPMLEIGARFDLIW